MRCLSCGAVIAELPRHLERVVKVKCQKCFGVAPHDSSPEIDELLQRGYRYDLKRFGELEEVG